MALLYDCPRCGSAAEPGKPLLLLRERREPHKRFEAGVAQAPMDASIGNGGRLGGEGREEMASKAQPGMPSQYLLDPCRV